MSTKGPINLTIEKINSRGEGLARPKGKVCFIPWGVPGDEVVVQIEKEHKDFDEGRIIEIKKKSPERIDPQCPYFYKCGGCQLQHMSYEAQLKSKHVMVSDALRRVARVADAPISPVLPSPRIWNYRNRLRLHRDRDGTIGLYEKESHRVVPIETCIIAEDAINGMILNLRKMPVTEACEADFELRTDQSRAFAQINPEQNQRLIETVVEFLGNNHHVFDLYCGNGNFTLPASKKSRHVWGIEKEGDSVNEGRMRSQIDQVTNVSWIHRSVTGGLLELREKGVDCDAVIVNPPRRGLDEALEALLPFKPRKVVYVSCDPATFARDLLRFTKSGYALQKCQPIDMFPQTAHVELVGLITMETPLLK